MAPPSYSELGKQAIDILTKGYHFGLLKLDCNTKTASGIEVTSSGASNYSSGKVAGSLETKYKYESFNISHKWETTNKAILEASCVDKLLEGLKLALVCSFSPQTRECDNKIKMGYGQDNFKIDSDFTLDPAGPMINASGVVKYEDFLAGCKTSIDTQMKEVTLNNFAVGYKTGDTILHAAVNNGNVINCSVFQKCADNIDAAVQVSWMTESSEAKVGLGAKYMCENSDIIRGMINDELSIGLGYQHTISKGVTLFLSANIMAKTFSEGGHKFGVALNLEA